MITAVLFPVLCVALPVLYLLGKAVYNIWWHPLSKFPGPRLFAASRMTYSWNLYYGTLNSAITEAHEKYGEVVRVAPDELSFISGDTAWQDIYGFHSTKSGKGAYLKDYSFYQIAENGVTSMLNAYTPADHSRHRKLLSHAFSDKALREQEPMLHKYINLLVQRMHETCNSDAKGIMDISKWYNFTTVDIIGDFAFGESFHCLENDSYHFFVKGMFTTLRANTRLILEARYPVLGKIRYLLGQEPPRVARQRFLDFAVNAVSKRLSQDMVRPDLMTYATRHQGEEGVELSRDELNSDASLTVGAGSETTATQLSGLTYLLCKNPEKLERLQRELRSVFASFEDINVEKVTNNAPYLVACLNEGLRCYPPVPTGFPRVVPAGGDQISGYHVPGATSVYMSQYAANHSSRNFKHPDAFIPERWLPEGEAEFASDKKGVAQPFSFGPRNCIGKHLAYAELRLVLAKVMWSFDIKLLPESDNWLDQKTFVLWAKSPLMVQLTPYAPAAV